MTSDKCDFPEGSQSTLGDMLTSNVSKSAGEENATGTDAGCGYVSVVFPITMMATGMVGNSLALVLVYTSYRRKENRRKKSFLLCIGSLALTDLFGQLLTSPIVISVYRADLRWERIDSSGNLCAFFGVCMTTFGLCALFMASAMAIERATAITNPHWYSNHMKTSVTKQTLVVIWCLVLLFALLPVAGVGKYTRQWPGTWCFISTGDREVPGNIFFSFTFALLGIFSLLVTVSCNVVTIRGLIIRCKTKSGTSQASKHWERLTTETVIQLMGIMCVLLVCWSPLLVLMLRMISTQVSSHECNSSAESSHPSSVRDIQLDCNFFLTAIRLASLNQILDPWVYLLLREILLRKFCLVANAVSNCSIEDQKETQTALDALNKQNKENLQKPQSSKGDF
ncbi:prostaglandin E2 receptor EP3 subtype [Phyllopteryx taeniolatus]|uniref:prostaglandin E2 receptor EP3 subtype n=1 Tax=Phyllopteryx taeniolatus TaxID=161469 RepID=UPI002AD471D8|nr:prostaglandin E2 receptor EP3 subtype [Phyllopteryx taeniolatus]